MNLNVRRYIYLSFIAVFIIVGAALLFYLQGYRYNQDKGRLERTGALVVESIPPKATVEVNGKTQDDTTPVALQSLQDGDYDVHITENGFQDWRKSLNVKPSRVTFTGKVRLWPTANQGQLVVAAPQAQSFLAPNGEHLVYQTDSGLSAGLWLMNLTTGKTELITRPSSGTPTSIAWAPSNRAVLVQQPAEQGETEFSIYSLTDATWSHLTLPRGVSPRLVRWGNDDGTLFVATGDQLYQWNRRLGSLQPLWQVTLQDFAWHDGLIFGLVRGADQLLSLSVFNPDTLQTVPLEQAPQLVSSASFLTPKAGWLPLLDQDRHMLYLLHSPLTELVPVRKLPDVLSIDWSADGSKLLLTNNFEIWQYQIEGDKLSLLERVGTPLTRSLFFGQEPYLITASGNAAAAIELDDRSGGRQHWQLASYSAPIKNLFLDHNQRTLTVQTDAGFWRLTVRREPDGLLSGLKL